MKITFESHKLMSFFVDNNCLDPVKQSKHTDNILEGIFKELLEGVEFVNSEKQRLKKAFYNPRITVIEHVKQIPKPTTFSVNGFPDIVRKTIDENCLSSVSYTFNMYDRKITIHFIIETSGIDSRIKKYNGYVDYILYW